MQVQSLALVSGLRIWYCCELWCRSQMWLGSGVASAMVQASNSSSDSTPSRGTSICQECIPKKQKSKKKKKNLLHQQDVEVPRPGIKPMPHSNLSHSSNNDRSLIHCTTREILVLLSFLTEICIEMITDLHTILQNNTEIWVNFTQFTTMVITILFRFLQFYYDPLVWVCVFSSIQS